MFSHPLPVLGSFFPARKLQCFPRAMKLDLDGHPLWGEEKSELLGKPFSGLMARHLQCLDFRVATKLVTKPTVVLIPGEESLKNHVVNLVIHPK